ncbi:hypothetical protein [Paenibacillus radicis (ex Xue et al. 2023)]|uniref:Uncharacterized protein n=1 Tax=Paenibacillus radicis (ex Xue et al. 2023) TaxID=2972489 RepID=A0ABT1YEI0_9BACL|nr:hypothetical protein [Paenibacillus radicis (ex Xue et al. 2023)]MCR8631608.1 hypothetical protein [Paenibacillus radicis (ex Xue et al. 2023)]
MTVLIIILVVLILIAIISRSSNRKADPRGKRNYMAPPKPIYDDAPLPDLLGIQPQLPLKPAVVRLEQALPEEFILKLRERILRQNPQMSVAEFNWKLLELKRYFLMTALLKDVPMFSQSVDDIWHEMLMFTREYSRFGETFIGTPVHHGPHSDGQPDPHGRAWFDWVYAQLFVPTPYSTHIWQPFFRHPLDPRLLDELRQGSESELTANRFNRAAAERYPEIRNTVSLLIRKAKEQAHGAVPGASYAAERPVHESAAYMPYLAGALMFYSAAEFANFEELMEPHFAEEELKRRAQEAGSSSASCGSGSGCSSSSWSDDNNRHHGNGSDSGSGDSSGGSDSGGSSSSCSSSSSSCSSSCGGGGD